MTTPLPAGIDAQQIITVTLEPNVGPMVVLDHALIARLEATLKALPKAAAGLILASGSNRVFVAGADLKSIDAMSHDELDAYLAYGQRVFGMLCALPYPTVAAINGAALGGGLELAMHCDALIASLPEGRDGQPPKPYPIGLPEAGLCICPGWGGTNLLPARVRDAADAVRRTCTGQTYTIDQAGTNGLVDALVGTPGELLPACAAWLREHRDVVARRRDGQPSRWIGRDGTRNAAMQAWVTLNAEFTTDPGAACLRAVHAGLEHGWPAALKVEKDELNRLRATPAGKGAIGAFLNKGKK